MITLEELNESHYKGFLATLSSLRKIRLSHRQFKFIIQERMERQMFTVVALASNEVVSTATVIVEPKFYGRVAHIEDVATREGNQGKGYGRAVVEWCIQKARDEGAYKAILYCADKNVKWYESLEFEKREWQMRMDL